MPDFFAISVPTTKRACYALNVVTVDSDQQTENDLTAVFVECGKNHLPNLFRESTAIALQLVDVAYQSKPGNSHEIQIIVSNYNDKTPAIKIDVEIAHDSKFEAYTSPNGGARIDLVVRDNFNRNIELKFDTSLKQPYRDGYHIKFVDMMCLDHGQQI